MKRLLVTIAILTALVGSAYAQRTIDTFPAWCEQLTTLGSEAMFAAVSLDQEAIRDDFAGFMNSSHLEKVENRAARMAWREGNDLHLVNLSSLLDVAPDVLIDEWRQGIGLANEFQHEDDVSNCLFGAITSLFDAFHIHSMEPDSLGISWTDTVTTIETGRATE